MFTSKSNCVQRIAVMMFSIFVFVSCTSNKTTVDYYLAKDGKCPYAIILSDGSSPSESYAATELQKTLKLAVGSELPIINEQDPRAQQPAKFVIGSGKLADQLIAQGKPVDFQKLGDEGFIIRTVKNENVQPDILIAGGRLRGTMYGVFTFLQKIGFRWYTNTKTWLPQDLNLPAPFMEEETVPLFMYRSPFITEAFDPDWAVRNRTHRGLDTTYDEAHGGSVRIMGVHTIGFIVPASLYKQHPNYFPMIGGKRVTGAVQRCLSNPDVVQVAAKNMIAWMDRVPSAKIFCLTQDDVEMYCHCPDCEKIMNEEGSPAGLYVKFVNEVAEIVEKVHPECYILTYAYWFTEPPPKTVKPRKNVIIQMSAISICNSHPLAECSDSASIKYYDHLQGWSKLSNLTFIWHYNINFRNLLEPFPDFREFPADIRTYYKNGVRGIFFQGSHFGPGGAESDLRAWVMAQLLWDPNQDADVLVNEWMQNVYGAAFKPMRAYFDLIHEWGKSPDHHLHIFERITSDEWPDDVIDKMDKLHDEALALAKGDSAATYYIMKNRVSAKFLKFILNTGRLQVVGNEYKPVGNSVTLADYDKFMDYAKQFGVKNLSENSSDSDLITRLQQRVTTYPLVTLENNDVKVDIAPGLGGRIVSLIHKGSGTNLINLLDPTENYYPVVGGYEEATTRTWGCVGFSTPYTAESKGRSVVLTAKMRNGLVFRRSITVPEKGAKVNFSSSITNENKKPFTYQLNCRMGMNADPTLVVVKARKSDGSFVVPVAAVARGTQQNDESYRYEGSEKPAGVWRLENVASNLSVENQFDEKQVETCILSTNSRVNLSLMEIRSAVREVPAGGKIVVNHSWEIK